MRIICIIKVTLSALELPTLLSKGFTELQILNMGR